MKSNYTLKRHPYTNTTGSTPVHLSGLAVLLALLVCLGAAFPQRLQAQTEVAKVQASDKGAFDFFGESVAISGDRAIVGALGEDTGAGAAYFFERDGSGTWFEVAKVQASD